MLWAGELAEKVNSSAVVGAGHRLPGVGPVALSECRSGCLRGPPPRLNLLGGGRVSVARDHAGDVLFIGRMDQKPAGNQPRHGRTKLDRTRTVRPPGTGEPVVTELRTEVMRKLVTLLTKANKVAPDLLLPHG
jgi:hypothetical protein